MAPRQRFIQTEVDRTPYGSCAWLAGSWMVLFLLGLSGIAWLGHQSANWQIRLPWEKATLNLPNSQNTKAQIQSELDAQRQQLQDEINQRKAAAEANIASSAASAATDAAKQAAQDTLSAVKGAIQPSPTP